MKKQILRDCIYRLRVKDHEEIKKVILSYVANDPIVPPNSFIDNISKFDWKQGGDFSRPWVKYFLPFFEEVIGQLLQEMGISKIRSLNAIWYQQYEKGCSHGWHIHDSHFTGVYYLELPKDSPHTEILHPFNHKVSKINAKEGDIIFFPSHVIHRAPANKGKRKTIISFNLDLFDRINSPFLVNQL